VKDTHETPDEYLAPSWRKRALILLLAVCTALGIVYVLLIPPTPVPLAAPQLPADVARCAPGQTQGCVGGTAGVIVAPRPASTPP
jgi:hypothetical protein